MDSAKELKLQARLKPNPRGMIQKSELHFVEEGAFQTLVTTYFGDLVKYQGISCWTG